MNDKRVIRLFLDTANIAELKEALSWGVFSGITANPVILRRESENYRSHVDSILEILPENWDISLQVKSRKYEEMVVQAKIVKSWDDRVRIKLPANIEGIKAAKKLANEMPINMTIIKSAAQAIICQSLAIQINAKDMVLSIFCGRLSQAGYNWREIITVLSQINWPGKILAASIKSPLDIIDAISHGAEIITAPLDVYKLAMNNPLVDEDLNIFNNVFDGKGFKILGDGKND